VEDPVVNRRRVAVAGFLGSVLVIGLLLGIVGVERIAAALSAADPTLFAAVATFGIGQVACWGLALRIVLRALDVEVPRRTGVALYASAMFANNVTPFGQAGGEPLTAYVIDRVTETRYETSLAAIVTLDAAHVATSVAVAVVGSLFTLRSLTPGSRLDRLGLAAIGVGVALAVLVYAVVRYRGPIARRLEKSVATLARRGGRVLPGRIRDLAGSLRQGVGQFGADISRVADDRTALGVVLAYSCAGWLCEVGALWVALWGLGTGVPVTTVLVLVPVAKVAGFAPLPGGFGSIEAALVGLIVTTTPADAGVATAAVFVHRGATYWLPIVIGGPIAGGLGLQSRIQ